MTLSTGRSLKVFWHLDDSRSSVHSIVHESLSQGPSLCFYLAPWSISNTAAALLKKASLLEEIVGTSSLPRAVLRVLERGPPSDATVGTWHT